jgi:hypothetical protein
MTKTHHRMMLQAALALLCSIAQLLPAQAPQGQFWIVDGNNGPGTNFTTISAAIAAAMPHDRILVRPAHYVEDLVINKGITIVGWNATSYPMTVPANPFTDAVQGTVLIVDMPNDQTLVVSGICVVPHGTPGYSVGIVNSRGPVVLDRVVIEDGAVFLQDGEDVLFQDVRIRAPHAVGGTPLNGMQVLSSWVQATGLDVTGGAVGPEPAYAPQGGAALEVIYPSVVALARPRLAGGSGSGPWNTTSATPAGGPAIRVYGGIVSMIDDRTGTNYVTGGQGGERGASSAPQVASGDGGPAIALIGGAVVNKKPMPLTPGSPGANQAGGPVGSPGVGLVQVGPGLYIPISEPPALFRVVGSTAPGGTLTITFQSASPGLLCGLGACHDFDLALLFNSPSVQFSAGKPSAVDFLALGTSNALSVLETTYTLPNPIGAGAGHSGMVQGADIVGNVAFLSNPSVIVFGF